jgi:hypothetical protein
MNTVGNNVFSLNFLVWKFGEFFQKFSKILLEFTENFQKIQKKKKMVNRVQKFAPQKMLVWNS